MNEICNREKGVPAGWITKDGSDVSDEFIRYAKPLIQGEVQVPQQDGLPLFAYRKKTDRGTKEKELKKRKSRKENK